jgi:hypothetical protein
MTSFEEVLALSPPASCVLNSTGSIEFVRFHDPKYLYTGADFWKNWLEDDRKWQGAVVTPQSLPAATVSQAARLRLASDFGRRGDLRRDETAGQAEAELMHRKRLMVHER